MERSLDWLFPNKGPSKQLALANRVCSGTVGWKIGLEDERFNQLSIGIDNAFFDLSETSRAGQSSQLRKVV